MARLEVDDAIKDAAFETESYLVDAPYIPSTPSPFTVSIVRSETESVLYLNRGTEDPWCIEEFDNLPSDAVWRMNYVAAGQFANEEIAGVMYDEVEDRVALDISSSGIAPGVHSASHLFGS